MSQLSDALDFERFFVKDLWSGIKKDPKRLVLGVDPASTWAWNKVLGRDDDPLVDQMGGPYGGKVISMGNPEGGVYGRAREAGINTAPAAGMHDIAHVVAGTYGAAGLGGAFGLGGGGAQGAQPGLWNQGFAGTTGFSGAPYGSAPAQGIGGIAGPVGGGTGASSAASLGPMDYAKLGMQAMPQQQPQQQPPPPPVRNMAPPKQVPTFAQRFSGGLGRVGEAMFPVDPNSGMTPEQTEALRRNALIQMGLGMMASSGRGAGFGESLASGYGLAQGNMQGTMQRNYENAMKNRAETRAVDRENRDIESDRWMRDRQQQRDLIGDTRATAEFDYRGQQDTAAQKRWEEEQKAMAKWREAQLGARRGGAPEVRQTDRGMMQWNPQTQKWDLVPGTEPSGIAGRPIPQGIAGDLKDNAQVIGMIDQVLPLLKTPEGRGAVGAKNAWIDALMPDAISDNIKNTLDPEGTQTRALVTNLNSFIVKQRNGAAVTVAEFARQRGFLPTDKDGPEAIEKKLNQLRSALSSEQQYILDFVESQGYRAPPTQIRQGAGLGQNAPATQDPLGIR